MPIISIMGEALTGSLSNVWKMAVIILPLMIFIELFKDLKLLDRLTSVITPLTRMIGVSREGNLPLLAGILFGIGYGSGIIIQSTRENVLSYKDIFLINLFLVICHSVLEDTVLYAAIGCRWFPVLIARIVLAIVICWIYRMAYSKWSLNNG